MSEPIEMLARFAPLAPRFDAFILDIWGVVMDGAAPYPGARECMSRLREDGKRVVLLSNAPRREAMVAERLAEIGIGPELYDRIVSSGEASRQALERRTTPELAAFGPNYLYIGHEKDSGLLDGLDYARVDGAGEADFVLNTGIIDDSDTLERFRPGLEAARPRDLPMICANPDLVVVRHGGARVLCAGAIAAEYERMGGTVHYFGKPHGAIYQACFDVLDGIAKPRMLAVGDNLDTDIAGAAAVGLRTALVLGGVLADALGIASGETAPAEKVAALCAQRGVTPDMAVPALVW